MRELAENEFNSFFRDKKRLEILEHAVAALMDLGGARAKY